MTRPGATARRVGAGAALTLALLAPAAGWAQIGSSHPGWATMDIPATGSWARRFIPTDLDATAPAPVVVFLHGAGATPPMYETYLEGAATGLGAVLLLPKSLGDAGWQPGPDDRTVVAALELLEQEIAVDPVRLTVAGHSSGGAYACLLALGRRLHFAAAFAMAAPFVEIAEVADPTHVAPVRMYYGASDPNYSNGSRMALVAQWIALGVPFEEDVRWGYGHNTWPDSAVEEGLAFLLRHVYTGDDRIVRRREDLRPLPGLLLSARPREAGAAAGSSRPPAGGPASRPSP